MIRKVAFFLLTLSLSLSVGIPAKAWYNPLSTTVEAISADTSEAEQYLTDHVGTVASEYRIPGLVKTISCTRLGIASVCHDMTPQDITYALDGQYMLISAYCSKHTHASVIYVLDGTTKNYISTLILSDSFFYNKTKKSYDTVHLGGIACDGSNIWVCNSTNASSYTLDTYSAGILNSVSGSSYKKITRTAQYSVGTKPSFMGYWNNYLYVGAFSDTATTTTVYRYYIGNNSYTLDSTFTVNGIKSIQGIAVRDDHMVITSSYGRGKLSSAYIFNLDEDASEVSSVSKEDAIEISLPNMAEGCYIGNSAVWFLFESGASEYQSLDGKTGRLMPIDNFVSFDYSTVGIQ